PPPATAPDLWKSVKKFSKDGPFVFASLGLMVFPIGFYFPLYFIQLDAVKHTLDANFAFYSLVIVNGSSLIGRLSPGFLVKYVSVVNLIVVWTGICGILIIALTGVTNVAGFVVFGVIYGFSFGAFIALMAPLIAVLSDNIEELGLRMGIAFALCGETHIILVSIGPPVQGALLGANFVWWKPAVFSGMFALVGTTMFGIMVYLLHRRQRKSLSSQA
ncbi:hypothetical protein P691DRAFT_682734, partial [Macrolepiota fuliginosa MF-IS2]